MEEVKHDVENVEEEVICGVSGQSSDSDSATESGTGIDEEDEIAIHGFRAVGLHGDEYVMRHPELSMEPRLDMHEGMSASIGDEIAKLVADMNACVPSKLLQTLLEQGATHSLDGAMMCAPPPPTAAAVGISDREAAVLALPLRELGRQLLGSYVATHHYATNAIAHYNEFVERQLEQLIGEHALKDVVVGGECCTITLSNPTIRTSPPPPPSTLVS